MPPRGSLPTRIAVHEDRSQRGLHSMGITPHKDRPTHSPLRGSPKLWMRCALRGSDSHGLVSTAPAPKLSTAEAHPKAPRGVRFSWIGFVQVSKSCYSHGTRSHDSGSRGSPSTAWSQQLGVSGPALKLAPNSPQGLLAPHEVRFKTRGRKFPETSLQPGPRLCPTMRPGLRKGAS